MRELDDTTKALEKKPAMDATLLAQDLAIEKAPPEARASLIVIAGWEIGREIELHGLGQVVGRSPFANIIVDSPSVSRRHAQLDLVEEEGKSYFTVSDLGSSNGTRVNNQPVTTARLKNGDKVRMGDVVFKFVLQDEADAKFHRDVHRLIHYDQLTGLMTMEAFRRQLEYTISRSAPDQPFTLAMTDLDGLKRVNDTHGHLAGRMIVREMGAMMRAAIRPGDHAGLYGGDEAIVLFSDTPIEEARRVAERLREAIETRVFEHNGASFQVTISQGLAEWPRHGEESDALIAVADRALYAAKAAGRNNVYCAGSEKS